MKNTTFSLGRIMPLFTESFKSKPFKIITNIKMLAFIIASLTIQNLNAQVEKSSELFQTMKKMDSIVFERGFNKCMHSEIEQFLSNDLEFYHDQGGITNSKEAFLETLKKNICANLEMKPIRKLTKGSLEVFPLYNNGNLYGAIQKGIHEFYMSEPDKDIYLTSTAKFTHVWVKENDNWKLKRVLSYDHIPASKKVDKIEISLSKKMLNKYLGKYDGENIKNINISINDNVLEMHAGEMKINIFPETKTLFFSKEAPLTFEFVNDAKGNVIKMIVSEHGKVVEEAIRVK